MLDHPAEELKLPLVNGIPLHEATGRAAHKRTATGATSVLFIAHCEETKCCIAGKTSTC